ncbi:MAG: TonB-dependent receptor, partial [Novosphingobium sp.]
MARIAASCHGQPCSRARRSVNKKPTIGPDAFNPGRTHGEGLVMNRSFATCTISAAALLAGLGIATPAIAQSADSTDAGEIIVTAQKRAQSVNDVGLSITAASGTELKSMGVVSTGDLGKITPGFTFTKSQDGTPLYTLRGVGFNDYTLGASPAVSVYVDQVPLAYGAFTQGASLDLERVEVLKGPQGILFGQNSTGGAINYIAAKPTDTLEAGMTASYSRFNTFDGEAFVSGPVAKNLNVRLSGAVTEGGAWQYNYTRKEKLGRQDKLQGRFQAEFKPADTVSFLLSVNGWRDKSDTQAGQLEGLFLQTNEASVAAGCGNFCDTTETARRIAAFRALQLAPQNARAADWDIGRDLTRDDSFYQVSLRSDVELASDITHTSITAYGKYKENYGVDRDGTSLRNAGVAANGRVKSFSQELRLAGNSKTLNWLLGINYASNDVFSANDIYTGDSTNTAILPAPLPWIAASTTTITQKIKDYAVFGNVEVAVTDQLKLLGGGRYTKTKNDYTSCMTGDIGMQTTFSILSNVLS